MSDDPNITARRCDTLPFLPTATPAGGRYVLGDEIARGGMGAVYRATDTDLGRKVAVKVLQEQFAADGGAARRFADEARIAAQLQHPGIPPVHELGTLPDGRPFLAMKLIKGDTLDALLAQRPDPAADRGRFVAAFEAICQAVAYAHSRGVIHRDLKPANVMVGAFGEVQVMDWGLAKKMRRAEGGVRDDDPYLADPPARVVPQSEIRVPNSDQTQAGSVLGTPAYMPPEQAAGVTDQIDARSDVFALGGILAAVLTGLPPFRGDTAEATRVKAAQGKVEECFTRLDGCGADPELIALCKRCLAPDQDARPADAGAVASAVAGLRQAAEARARQAELDRVKAEGETATAETKAAEQRKRRRVQLALAAAVVLMVAGAGGVATYVADRRAAASEQDRLLEKARGEREAAELRRLAAEVEQARVVEKADRDRRDERQRQQAQDEQLAQAERARQARAAEELTALLDQAKAALATADADRAAPFVEQAARRAASDTMSDHASRITEYQRDLSMLRELDRIDAFRWTVVNARVPPPEKTIERWKAAFAQYGIVPGKTPPAAAAARINSSAIRTSLLATIDIWLSYAPAAPASVLLAIPSTSDPDPFRSRVRRLLVIADRNGLEALWEQPEWHSQPAGLIQAYAVSGAVSERTRRAFLLRMIGSRPDDYGLLMLLGGTYPVDDRDGAPDRTRWFQAATASRPRNVAARNNLGIALLDSGDAAAAITTLREATRLDPTSGVLFNNLGNALSAKGMSREAATAYRESVRLDPGDPAARMNLGKVSLYSGDLEGALGAFRQAIQTEPTYAPAHHALGVALEEAGDAGGAVTAYREAVRLEPTNPYRHVALGNGLLHQGNTDAAVNEYREAIRLDPKSKKAHNCLGRALRFQGDVAGAIAAYRAHTALDPGDALAHESLAELLRRRGLLDDAVDAYRAALAVTPHLSFAREGLAYTLRLQRGEVPTAPPPRAVAR